MGSTSQCLSLALKSFHSRNNRQSKIATLIIVGQIFRCGSYFIWSKIVSVQLNDRTKMKINTSLSKMKLTVVDLSIKLIFINCFFMNFWKWFCSCGTNWNCTTIYILLTLAQLSNRQNQTTTLLHSFVMSTCDIQENQCNLPSPMNLWYPDFLWSFMSNLQTLKKNNMYLFKTKFWFMKLFR